MKNINNATVPPTIYAVPTGCPNYDTRTLIEKQAAHWLIYPHFRNRALLHIDNIDTQQRGEIGARIRTFCAFGRGIRKGRAISGFIKLRRGKLMQVPHELQSPD